MAKTFKDLQDDVLEWMADDGDTGLMRTLVKQNLDNLQRQLLTGEQFDFMLTPIKTLSIVAPTQRYRLPDDYLQGLYFYDSERDEFMEEIPPKTTQEAEDGLSQTEGINQRYQISIVQGVQDQPSSAGVVTATTTGGTELAANGFVIQGLDSSGNWIEEALSSGSPWSSLSTTSSFQFVANIIKTGTTWTRTVTLTRGTTTLLALLAGEYVKQYQMFELPNVPTQAQTVEYRYYKKVIPLVYDNQLPQVPEQFVDILLYMTLLGMQGYTRATGEELSIWSRNMAQLTDQMRQTYQQARTLGSRARYVRMVPRI